MHLIHIVIDKIFKNNFNDCLLNNTNLTAELLN